jgi:hypothetical protein
MLGEKGFDPAFDLFPKGIVVFEDFAKGSHGGRWTSCVGIPGGGRMVRTRAQA